MGTRLAEAHVKEGKRHPRWLVCLITRAAAGTLAQSQIALLFKMVITAKVRQTDARSPRLNQHWERALTSDQLLKLNFIPF